MLNNIANIFPNITDIFNISYTKFHPHAENGKKALFTFTNMQRSVFSVPRQTYAIKGTSSILA
jgi:hypothetical protein